MGFAVSIQSAPELRGTVSAASAWDGASTSVVTTLGKYSGAVDLTFTVTQPLLKDFGRAEDQTS